LGTIEQGAVTPGDTVLVSAGREEVRVTVQGLEILPAVRTKANAGQGIGMQIKGVDPKLIRVGSIVKSAASN